MREQMAYSRFSFGLRNDENEGAKGAGFKTHAASQPANTSQKNNSKMQEHAMTHIRGVRNAK